MNAEKYILPVIGPINLSYLILYYQSVENISELKKRLEHREIDPSSEIPRIINKGIRNNYLQKGIFSFYLDDKGIICVMGREYVNEIKVNDYTILLSDPKPLTRELYSLALRKFLLSFISWKLDQDRDLKIRVGDAYYFKESVIGKSREGLEFMLLHGFSLRIISHLSGFYIYVLDKFLPRIKPTLDRILRIDIFRGTYEYLRGEYYWDGLLKEMSCITTDEYFRFGKPSYAGRIVKVVYSDVPIYQELRSSIKDYYSRERGEIRKFIEERMRDDVPIVLTYKGRRGAHLLSYLSSILYLAPSIMELRRIVDVLGFRQIVKWYIDAMNPNIDSYIDSLNKWASKIMDILNQLPLKRRGNILELSGVH